eukprot:scaffold15.g4279.t1
MMRAPLLLAALLGPLAAAKVDKQLRSDLNAQRYAPEPIQYTEEGLRDRVDSLPGWGKTEGFELFSGYVTVDEKAGRALFYVFVASQSAPSTDPVVLWLNGGPGCSSLGGGFLSELGPFYPTPGGKALTANDYAWNRVASLLFLDSPAFVGWSYSNSSADRVTGDKQTAVDAHTFLLRWFDRFPHLRQNAFWLSGESYAGHYVPNLAWEIVKGNSREGGEEPINLQGFLVGNAWTSPNWDNPGALDFWFSHGMVSHYVRKQVYKHCDFGVIGPLREDTHVSAIPPEADDAGVAPNGTAPHASRRLHKHKKPDSEKCEEYVNLAMQQISGINIYDIYVDVCLPPKAGAAEAHQLALMLHDHPGGLGVRSMLHGKYDPCVDNEVELYFNRKDVQWRRGRDRARRVLGQGSGATEPSRIVIGTRRWLHDLKLDVSEDWRDWRSTTGQAREGRGARGGARSAASAAAAGVAGDERGARVAASELPAAPAFTFPLPITSLQVGGWTQKYKQLVFASVPYTQPERALYLFSNWVHQKPL